MPSDEGWGEVSKIKATKWLMDLKARDRSGIDDWDITTPAIVKKKYRNKAERSWKSNRKGASCFPFFFMCNTWCHSSFYYVLCCSVFWFVLSVIDF